MLCERENFGDIRHEDSTLELKFRVLVYFPLLILLVFLVLLSSHDLIFGLVWVDLLAAQQDAFEKVNGILFIMWAKGAQIVS